MKYWPEEDRLRGLILTAMAHSEGFKYESDEIVTASLDKVCQLMDTPVRESNQLKLMISAAMQHIRKLEANVLDSMRLDRWVSMHDEAILVRIRLICAELLGILTDAFDEMHLVRVGVRF